MALDLNLSVSAIAIAFASDLADFETAQDGDEDQLDALAARVAALELGTTPTPAPAFTQGPVIVGTPRVGQTLTGMSIITNGTVVSRRWLLGTSVLAVAQTYIPQAAGSLIYEETATGPGGTTVKASAAVTVVEGATGGPLPQLGVSFLDGMNVIAANYYTASTLESNYGRSCGVDNNGGSFGSIFTPHAGINGLATWKTNTGFTIEAQHPSMEVLSTNSATGVHRVNIKYDATDTVARAVIYRGATPTFITVTRDGIAGEFSPEALGAYMGAFMRNLDMTGANAVSQNGAQLDAGQTDDSPFNSVPGAEIIPIERQIRFVAAKRAVDPKFHGLYDVIPIDRTVEQRRYRAQYMRDHGGGAYYAFQCGNEDPWNIRFSGVVRVILEGFRHGYYGAGTLAQPAAKLTIVGDTDYRGPGAASSPATTAGSYVMFSIGGRGLQVYRAKKTVPAGSPVDENEFWERLFDHPECIAVGKNYQAAYLNETIEIVRQEYGETRFQAEVVPLIMGQHGGANSNGSVLGQFAQHRAFVPELWAKIGGLGWASYLDINIADGFDKQNATATTMGDFIRTKAWPKLKGQLATLQAEADSEGKVIFMYEGGLSLPEDPDETPAVLAASLAYDKSDEMALMTADYVGHLRQTFRGVAVFFTAIAPDAIHGNRASIWGQRYSFNETTSRRYIGYQMGLDPSYVPRVPPAAGTLMRLAVTREAVEQGGYPSLCEVRFRKADGTLIAVAETSGDQRGDYEGHARLIDGDITTVWTGLPNSKVVFAFANAVKPVRIEMEDRHDNTSRAPAIFFWEYSADNGATWAKVFDQKTGPSYTDHVLTIAPTYPT